MGTGSTDRRSWDRDGPLVLAGEPRLAFQPIVDLVTGRVLGFEALLRWEHPTEGPILPKLLIPWAEANGDIVALGGWVLLEGCRQAADWPPSVQLAVNCSIVQLRRGVAAEAVRTALEESGLTPDRLTVEVTEHALSEEAASNELRAIAGLGAQLAVDDVGTSWNSFELLRQLAVNTIKIDESFVSGLEGSEGINRMVVETVIHLAHSCGMATVAEGVESAHHAAVVRAFESDAAQGYFFAPPLEAESAAAVAKMTDLTFPLEGTGWVDDDDWPFPGVRAERAGIGNSLSHARHARPDDRGVVAQDAGAEIDLTDLVLPGLPGSTEGRPGTGPGEEGEPAGAAGPASAAQEQEHGDAADEHGTAEDAAATEDAATAGGAAAGAAKGGTSPGGVPERGVPERGVPERGAPVGEPRAVGHGQPAARAGARKGSRRKRGSST